MLFSPSEGRKEIVLLVSAAACGKSTFSRTFNRDLYTVVNQDTLKTVDKCIKSCLEELSKGKSVVVDNSNSRREVRGKWVRLAQAEKVQIRCVVLNTPKDVCFSLAAFRLADPRTTNADRRDIDKIVIHSGFKHMLEEKVTTKEGFSRVDEVNWSPILPSTSTAINNSNEPLRNNTDIAMKLFCSYLK
jgi:bifunctional polynucleotide phosphatase/kinase